MRTRTFNGRPIVPGGVNAPALVSQRGFNALASFFPSLINPVDIAVCGDRHNDDTYEQQITGSVLCVPTTTGSTSTGSTFVIRLAGR